MIRPIMARQFFLRQPSEEATAADLQVALDLADTLAAHRPGCVGMAANMIGQRKRIIAVTDRDDILIMFNPRIVKQTGPYQTQEGCLSLEGVRSATRYRKIEVEYQDKELQPRRGAYTGDLAQAIQHEVDHCDGILI